MLDVPECCQSNVARWPLTRLNAPDSHKSRARLPTRSLRFTSLPDVIRLVVMTYVRFWMSLRKAEDLLFQSRIDLCHEAARHWWDRSLRCSQASFRRGASAGSAAQFNNTQRQPGLDSNR